MNTRTPQQTPAPQLAAPTHNAPIAPLLITNKTITLAPSDTHIKPNLKLAKGGPRVLLVMTFFDSNGGKLPSPDSQTVKESHAKKYKIPPKAISASFDVFKSQPTDKPVILRFEPETSSKPAAKRP